MEKITITGGYFVNLGATLGRGNSHTPLYLQRKPAYIEQLKELYNGYVVFYDTVEHRAWLVNGANALLHLVRASLRHDSKGPLKSDFLFNFKELYEAPPCSSFAALEVLKNPLNMKLEIFCNEDELWTEEVKDENGGHIIRYEKKKFTKVRFQDRVNQMYIYLKQIQEHHTKLSGPGMPLRITARNQLEGFDFMEIATGSSPIDPRYTTLKPSGKGWVDFTRTIHAPTLFGRGFGDLLRPADNSNKLCALWGAVPAGNDYLAACTSDLANILAWKGDVDATPMKLASGIYWHKAHKLFEDCECKGEATKRRLFPQRKTCDRVQVLLPPSLGRKQHPGLLGTGGAVIFGRSTRYPWRWPDHGLPEQELEEKHEQESEAVNTNHEIVNAGGTGASNGAPSSSSFAATLSTSQQGTAEESRAVSSTSATSITLEERPTPSITLETSTTQRSSEPPSKKQD